MVDEDVTCILWINCINGGYVSLWLLRFSFVGGMDTIKWEKNRAGDDEWCVGLGCD